jgi:DNA-binding NtrC family response regulator
MQNLIECIVQIYPGDIIVPEYILDNVSYNTRKTLEKAEENEHVPENQKDTAPAGSGGALKEPPKTAFSAGTSSNAPSYFNSWPNAAPPRPASANTQGENSSSDNARPVRHHRKITEEMLLAALRSCGNNRSAAAEYLGISRRTMYRKMEEFGIE